MKYIESTVKSSSSGERTPYGERTIGSTLETVSFIIWAYSGSTSHYRIPTNTPLFLYRLANGSYCVAFQLARFNGIGVADMEISSNGGSSTGSLPSAYVWAEYNDNSYYCVSVNNVFSLGSNPPKNDFISVTSTNDIADAFLEAIGDAENYQIVYYLTNCSAPSAPTSVQPGGTVSFPVTVSPGYNIFNPVQGGSISVYQGNDYIPFTFENGQLTFTAPGGG